MVVVARPNIVTAVRSRLLTFPEVTSLISSPAGWVDGRTEARIGSQIHSAWKMPTRAIWLNRVGGPQTPDDYSMGLWRSRIDLYCYGGAGHEAQDLMDIVIPALCVRQSSVAAFTLRGCRVVEIAPEADGFADVNPATRWPHVLVPIMVTWGEGA